VPLIGPSSLARNGAYAIWLDPGGIRLLSVRDVQGERPWVAPIEEPSAEEDQ